MTQDPKDLTQAGTISVCIPTYKHEQYIAQTLESLLAQTRPPHQIIVINDGSPDNTADAVAPYLDRITYIEQANTGVVKALHRGMQMCTGDYVVLMGSDDWTVPDSFAVMGAILDTYPDVGLVHGGITYVDSQGCPIPDLVFVSFPKGKHHDTVQLIQEDYIPAPATMCRREALIQAGPFLPNYIYYHDWAIWMGIALSGWQMYGVDRSLTFYRRHGGNMTYPRHPVQEFQDGLKAVEEISKKYHSRLTAAEHQAFDGARRNHLRRLGWSALGLGQRHLATSTFLRLLLREHDVRAFIGLATTLMPLQMVKMLQSNLQRTGGESEVRGLKKLVRKVLFEGRR